MLENITPTEKGFTYTCSNGCHEDLSRYPEGKILISDYQLTKGVPVCRCNPNSRLSDKHACLLLGEVFPEYENINIVKQSGTKFFEYSCKICAEDIYSKNDIGSSVFTKNKANMLKSFNKSCRCNDKHPWTQEQREFQIGKALSGKFLQWDGVYKNSNSSFTWQCEEGHISTSTPDNTLNNHRGCRICNSSVNGFFPKRVNEDDLLYLLRFTNEEGESFLKVGRTFNLSQRLEKLNQTTYLVEVLLTKESTHRKVYALEQKVLQKYKKERFKPSEKFVGAGECLNMESLDRVVQEILTNI